MIRSLSVVIPAYNEDSRIEQTLRRTVEFLKAQPLEWEGVVVDDGSVDRTFEVVAALAKDLPGVRCVRHPINQGKGAAVLTGLKAASKEAVLFCDADGATALEQLREFLPHLAGSVGMVVGSRQLKESKILIPQQRLRRWMSGLYRRLCQWFLIPGISDVTCGFKLLSRRAVDLMIPRMKIRRWSFDAEMFLIARLHGLGIVEVPVVWRDQGRTKVHLLRDGLGSFLELLRIRWCAAFGAYR